MPNVHPFRAVQYTRATGDGDLSALIAPPYDVLDAAGKAALLASSDRNVVALDLPHLPAKELGPAAAYEGAAGLYRAWLEDGTLFRRERPAMFVYRETFRFGERGTTHQRTGMACTVETLPFGPRPGGGILPHEETFSGPKEDRFALMKAAKAQFSPIFGLHPDEAGQATRVLTRVMASRPADTVAHTGTGFGGRVEHEVWTIEDDGREGTMVVRAYTDALRGEDVFIADGHHRYNTALNYLKKLEEGGGGKGVPSDHPARRCLIVLVGMSDPGLVIGPTHRVLGGMKGYSWEAFERAAAGKLTIKECGTDLRRIEAEMEGAARMGAANALGLYDFATRRCFVATPVQPDPLKDQFPQKVASWRGLDVAIVQYLIVEGVCQPALNGGEAVKWAFPHSIEEVVEIGEGKEKGSGGGKAFAPQLGVIVRPTPLEAVREVSRAGELMPQKSTFFYPKLATGLFINPVE